MVVTPVSVIRKVCPYVVIVVGAAEQVIVTWMIFTAVVIYAEEVVEVDLE